MIEAPDYITAELGTDNVPMFDPATVGLSIRPQTFTLQLKLTIKEPTMSNEFFSDYDYELYIQAVLEDLDHACVPDEDDCNHYYSGEPVSQEEVEAELKEAFEYLVNNAK